MPEPKIRYDILANAQGADSVERLASELDKLDAAFDPAVAQRAQALANELRELGAQQAAIQRFRELKEQTTAASTALATAQDAAQKMGAELSATERPTRAQAGQMEKLRDAVKSAKLELQAQTAALDASRGNLSQFGIATDAVAGKEVALRTALQGTRQEVQQLGQQQQAIQRFIELGNATDKARTALTSADDALEAFRRQMTGVAEPTRAQQQQLSRLTETVRQAQVAVQGQAQAQAQAGAALRAVGVDTERLTTAQSRARSEINATSTAAQTLAGAYGRQGAAAVQSAAQQAAANKRAADSVTAVGDQLNKLKNIGLAGILGSQTAQLLKSVGETADQFSNLSARVRLVTGDGREFTEAMAGIFEVAKRTSSGLDGTATLFTRIAQAGKEIGLGQKEALALTESINQAIQLSGGSATSADAAITQLIQGLQSGVLRGEEFNSVMEQAPRLAQALAAGLKVTTGELRNMAKEGQLTSATVIQALRDQGATLKTEFGQLPATLGRAVTNLSTEWTKFIGALNSSTGATATVAAGIDVLANNLQTVADVAARAGVVLVAALAIKGVSALRALATQAVATAGTANVLATSISKIPTIVNITIAAVGFEIGFKIGTMLHENFALARQLGVGIVAFFENVVNDLHFVADAAAAVFNDDTITQAFDRYRERGKQLDETFSDMWEEAKRAPQAIASAANDAAQSTAHLGQAGQAAGQQIGSAAGTAAGAVGGVGKAAETALGALQGLAVGAKLSLPLVGASAGDVARILVDLGLKGKGVAQLLGTEIPQAISKLSGPELVAFRAGMVAALESSITASRRLAEGLEAAGKSSEKALGDVALKAQLLQQVLQATGQRAAEALGVDVAAAGRQITEEFQRATDNLAVLVRSLPALKAAGVDTASVVGQALAQMIDSARNQAEIDLLLQRLEVLGAAGVIGPQAVAGAFELAADKVAELNKKLDDATPGISSLAEAARKAGVDVDQLTTGVSKNFRDASTAVAEMARQIIKSGVAAERAAPLLQDALDQRVTAAKTREELQLLAKVVQELGGKGQLSGSQVSGALDEIKRKAEELSPALRQAKADAERLGITLADSVGNGAKAGVEGAIGAYERLKHSGRLSAGELQAAFTAMANEVIKANGGIVPEWIKVEAAIRGATIGMREFADTTIQGAGDALKAVEQLVAGIGNVNTIRSPGGPDNKLGADGGKDLSVLGKNDFSPVDNTAGSVIAQKLASNTLAKEDLTAVTEFLRVARENLALTSNLTSSAAGVRDARNQYETARLAYERLTSPGLNVNPADTEGSGFGVGFGSSKQNPGAPGPFQFQTSSSASSTDAAKTSTPAAAASSTAPYVVSVVIGGQASLISSRSKTEADAFIKLLEDAYRAGGGTGS